MDEITQEFLIESNELLDQLDRDLVDLEKDTGSKELLARVFRTFIRSRARVGLWVFPNWNRWPMLGKTC